MHVWARLIMDRRTVSNVPKRFQKVDRHQECTDEVSLHFKIDVNKLGFLTIPTDKNLKDWSPHVVGLYLEN
jgi:hypothetical protein